MKSSAPRATGFVHSQIPCVSSSFSELPTDCWKVRSSYGQLAPYLLLDAQQLLQQEALARAFET